MAWFLHGSRILYGKRHHRSVSRYEVAAFGGYEDDERTLGHTAKNFSTSATG